MAIEKDSSHIAPADSATQHGQSRVTPDVRNKDIYIKSAGFYT